MPERTNHRAIIALLLGLWLSVGLLQAEAGDRSIGVAPGGQLDSVPITGEYWAVLIGIDEYAHAPNLESAVRDVRAVRAVLETRYGFHPSRIKQLLNAQATRKNIENTLYALSREAGPEDSVFIYYAGHGQYDQARDHGWWVPTDGEPRQAGTLITNANILRYVKGMQARHVYLVADSCFSGSLFGTRALPPITDRWYAELYKDRSRWGLTSGATEPVADRGLGGHSPFAYFLLKVLRENEQPYLVPSTIHESLAPLVANNTNQVPRSEPLTQTGDEGGQFVFRLTDIPSASPAPPVVDLAPYQQLQQQTEYQRELEKAWSIVRKFVTTPGFTTEQRLQALKQFERDFPTANPHRDEVQLLLQQMEAENKYADLSADKEAALLLRLQQLEAENPVEADKASIAGYPAGHRFRDCPSCPEMVVVPAGSYEMGSSSSELGRDDDEGPVHQVTIAEPFAVGKYEVTFDEWDACVVAVGCKYQYIDHGGRGNRPVSNATWDKAQEYVSWLSRVTGKTYRLLSEAEWEYVARAGSTTAYPWGDGIDTNKANCDGCGSQWDEQSPAPVGSFEANAFGVFDTAGNVWEWVEDCYHDSYEGAPDDGSAWTNETCWSRVLRGGSWGNSPKVIRSAYRLRFLTRFLWVSSPVGGLRVARTLD